MAFVSTLGSPDQNSLLSVEEATTLLGDLPQSEGVVAWLALSTASKQRTLVAASMITNSLRWKGAPLSADQGLAWPRRLVVDHYILSQSDSLPRDFASAVAYLAAFLGENGGYTAVVVGDGGVDKLGNNEYEEVELGDGALRVKFDKSGKLQTGSIVIPPFSMDIFSRYMIDRSFHQPRITRESNARLASGRTRRLRLVNDLIYFTNY